MEGVCSAILPTIVTLRKINVFLGEGCCLCSEGDESIEHISRDCQFMRDLIGSVTELAWMVSRTSRAGSIQDWLLLCQKRLNNDLFALLLMMIWSVWKERNLRLWPGK